MVAETISLGILALPRSLKVVGMIPGLILLIGFGILASYSGYVIGQYKIAYPHIHSMADAGEVLFGRIGREILGAGQLLFFVFIMGSHILTFAIAMDAITDGKYCNIIWMVVGLFLSLVFTIPRTLKHLSFYSIASFASIIGAVMITMIGVSITKPGYINGVPSIGMWPRPGVSFHDAFEAVNTMVFAYAGHVAFFSFISELREPRDFPKALAFLQASDISMYIITAVVVYYYAGVEVKSPALLSASPVVMKVAFGIAMPTIIIAGVVNGHVAVKYLYVRMFRNSKDDVMHQKTLKAWGSWIAICATLWVLAWLIAEAVPVFNHLVSLTSALFASWFTFGLSGMFWLDLNLKWEQRGKMWLPTWKRGGGWRKWFLTMVNIGNVIIGALLASSYP